MNPSAKVYQVGGSVRDRLLGIEPNDIDYVVVGSSHEEMMANGYSVFGKHFPVYIHPITKCEYALARRERKTGPGYNGFECDTDQVSLEDDLLRRDLTINAMAIDDNGNIIDPHGGQKDLQDRILRHVSQAFCEDPLRIVRIAKFLARGYDFTVHESTLTMVKAMVCRGAHTELSPQRVGREFYAILQSKNPIPGLCFLHEVGFFKYWWPVVHQYGINTVFLSAVFQDQRCDPARRLPALINFGVYMHESNDAKPKLPLFPIMSVDEVGIFRIHTISQGMIRQWHNIDEDAAISCLEENNAFHIPLRAQRALHILKHDLFFSDLAYWWLLLINYGLEFRENGTKQKVTKALIADGARGDEVSSGVSLARAKYIKEQLLK